MEKSPKSTILIYVQRVELQMKIGDLVERKTGGRLGLGIILSKQMAGSNPVHPCITVLYPKVGKVYDIAESLMKVVSKKEKKCEER